MKVIFGGGFMCVECGLILMGKVENYRIVGLVHEDNSKCRLAGVVCKIPIWDLEEVPQPADPEYKDVPYGVQ